MATSDWQQVDISIRPLLFTAVGADVLLCLVVESSVLGRDMWMLAGYTPVSVQQDPVIRDAATAAAAAAAAAAVSRDERAAATAGAAAAALLEKLCSLRRQLADVPRSGKLAELVKRAQDELRQRFNMDMQTGGSLGGMSSQTVERTVSGFPYLEFARLFPEYLHDMDSRASGSLSWIQQHLQTMLSNLREEASKLDQQILTKATFAIQVGKTLPSSDPSNKFRIDVSDGHGLRPMDEIVIGSDEYNRVRALGSIITFFQLACPLEEGGLEIKKLCIGPVFPASNASSGKTLNFLEQIEIFDPELEEQRLEQIVRDHGGNWPNDAKKRKEQLISLYTGEALYRKVNQAMYTDDPKLLKEHAAYIRALRDVFKQGQADPIDGFEPFSGEVTRRMKLDEEAVIEYVERFARGQEVCWSAFTSTSEACKGGNDEFGDLEFKIRCNMSGKVGDDDHYFPASVSRWSKITTESEVILPPHTFFRIVNVQVASVWTHTVVIMETTNDPCVWKVIQAQTWGVFEAWAQTNCDLVDTRYCKFSIINAVAKAVAKAVSPEAQDPKVNPLTICIQYGANPNEVDKETGNTPLSTLARAHSRSTPQGASGVVEAIKTLLHEGADPNLKGPGGQSFLDILPGYDLEAHNPEAKDIDWMYWVQDGVDGKSTGWYRWDASAAALVESKFQDWLAEPGKALGKILSIQSTNFSYDVDFSMMRQRNTTTSTIRKIRRHVEETTKKLVIGKAW